MVEFKKALDLLNLIESQSQVQRRKKRDQERDQKIKYLTDLILEKKITISIFLEAMSNKQIMPKTGTNLSLFFLLFF